MGPTMNTDEYGEALNGEDTYQEIATQLTDTGSCIVGWSDEEGTHLDVLFTYSPVQLGGLLQGGLSTNDLFVSIMRIGAFGFEIANLDTHPTYYGGKLGLGHNATTQKLAELINGVKKKLSQ